MRHYLQFAPGQIIQLDFKENKNLKFISQNGYIVSVLQNGKIIANSTGFAVVEVYKDDKKYAEVLCTVIPGKSKYPSLINRYTKVTYPAGDLKRLDTNYASKSAAFYTVGTLQKNFYKMCEDAKNDNVFIYALTAYRSVQTQISMIDKFIDIEGKEAAMKRCAPAGFSEHHTGLCMDVGGGSYENGEFVKNNQLVYDWIEKNAFKYGFMIKNLPNKEHITGTIHEPWHIRYIGNKRIAKLLHNEQITLDEYYDKYVPVSTKFNADVFVISPQSNASDI